MAGPKYAGAAVVDTRAVVLASLIWGPTHWAVVFPLAVLLLGLMVLLVLGLARFDRWRAQLSVAPGQETPQASAAAVLIPR